MSIAARSICARDGDCQMTGCTNPDIRKSHAAIRPVCGTGRAPRRSSARPRAARGRPALATRGRTGTRADDADGGDDAVVSDDGNGDGHRAGDELAVAPGDAVGGDLAEVVAQLADVGRRERQAGGAADDLVEDLGRGEGEQRPGERPAGRAGRCGRLRASRAAALADGISCRQTADRPMRRLMTAVSPVSSTSSRRIGSATRISSSLLTLAPLPMSSRGPSR